MNNATLERLLSEAKASGATNWVAIIGGAQAGLPRCGELVRELLSQQPATHWSHTTGWEEDYS
jgi:hypothetical protein